MMTIQVIAFMQWQYGEIIRLLVISPNLLRVSRVLQNTNYFINICNDYMYFIFD
jgi:hypothetical protein